MKPSIMSNQTYRDTLICKNGDGSILLKPRLALIELILRNYKKIEPSPFIRRVKWLEIR